MILFPFFLFIRKKKAEILEFGGREGNNNELQKNAQGQKGCSVNGRHSNERESEARTNWNARFIPYMKEKHNRIR